VGELSQSLRRNSELADDLQFIWCTATTRLSVFAELRPIRLRGQFGREAMFRAEIHEIMQRPVLKLEGKLIGDWAEEARSLVSTTSVPKGLIVDITDVSYVDAAGEAILSWFSSIGARFIADAIYAAAVCEQLQLVLA